MLRTAIGNTSITTALIAVTDIEVERHLTVCASTA